MAILFQIPKIVTSEDYIENYQIPKEKNNEEVKSRINIWIDQTINQFDSLISPKGSPGKLYDWWNSLDKEDLNDQIKGSKVQRAILSWVETFILNGKFWADDIPIANANIDVDLNSSSDNSDVEKKRNDIINDLMSIGLYNKSNLVDSNNLEEIKTTDITQDFVEAVAGRVEQMLANKVLFRNPTVSGGVTGPLNMNNNGILQSGSIKGYGNGPTISNFRLEGIDTSLLKINAEKIYDPVSLSHKFINEFGIEYFNGYTKLQVQNLILANSIIWQPTISYRKGTVVSFLKPETTLLYQVVSKVDNNINNLPQLNISDPNWLLTGNPGIDLNEVIDLVMEQVNSILPTEVSNQLNKLPTVNYISEGANQILSFDTEEDFNNYKTIMGVDDSYFRDIEEPTTLVKEAVILTVEDIFIPGVVKSSPGYGRWNLNREKCLEFDKIEISISNWIVASAFLSISFSPKKGEFYGNVLGLTNYNLDLNFNAQNLVVMGLNWNSSSNYMDLRLYNSYTPTADYLTNNGRSLIIGYKFKTPIKKVIEKRKEELWSKKN